VVIDFGTALTINVATPAGAFAGGLIALGLSSAAKAMKIFTPRLPELSPKTPRGFLLKDTRSALESGLIWQQIGGIQRMEAGLRRELPFSYRLIITGGDAGILAPYLPNVDAVLPDLLLEGLYHAAPAAPEFKSR
jgi:type III pantothenate kinase